MEVFEDKVEIVFLQYCNCPSLPQTTHRSSFVVILRGQTLQFWELGVAISLASSFLKQRVFM